MVDVTFTAAARTDDLWLEVPRPGVWAARARCRTVPQSVFFPRYENDEAQAQAREVCSRCPVADECRAYAMAHPRLVGMWGGLSAAERRAARPAVIPPPVVVPAERPPSRTARGTLLRTLTDLAGHPGRWARVAHYAARDSAPAVASQLRTGKLLTPPGRWQFEGRAAAGGGSDLYAILEEAS